MLTRQTVRKDRSSPDLDDEPSSDPPRVPPASADVMPTSEDKVQRAEQLLLSDGTWERARAEPGINKYNAQKRGAEKFNLRVVVKKNGRANEFRSNGQKAKLPNGATLYDGGDDGVFDSEVTATSHKLRFRLWVELGFPDMKALISELSDAARCRLDRERQAAATMRAREKRRRRRAFGRNGGVWRVRRSTRRRRRSTTSTWRNSPPR